MCLCIETHLFALRSMGGFSLSKGARCPHYVASVTAKGPLGSGRLSNWGTLGEENPQKHKRHINYD